MAKKIIKPEDGTPDPVSAIPDPNTEQARIIFNALPHIHSIWFDETGAWRYYETPGSIPIHKGDITDTQITEED